MADYVSDSEEDEFQSADEGEDEHVAENDAEKTDGSQPDVTAADASKEQDEQQTVPSEKHKEEEQIRSISPKMSLPTSDADINTPYCEPEGKLDSIMQDKTTDSPAVGLPNISAPIPDLSKDSAVEDTFSENDEAQTAEAILPGIESLSIVASNDVKTNEPEIVQNPEKGIEDKSAETQPQQDINTEGNEMNKMETEETKKELPPDKASQMDNKDEGVIVEQPKSHHVDDAPPEDDKAPEEWNNDGWGWDAFENVISSAVGKVEASLGIPSPQEFVCSDTSTVDPGRKDEEEESQPSEPQQQQAGLGSWFSGFGSHLTSAVQKTSQDLVTGSVGALEYIGKKTIDVLSEGDPGLRKKRGKGGPSLSQVLREAQEKIESEEKDGGAANAGLNFTTEFERFSGMDHLQTLEVLSNESERKLDRILNLQSDEALDDSKEMLLILTKNFILHEGSSVDAESMDFGKQLRLNCENMRGKATLSVEKLINTHKRLLEDLHEKQQYDETCELEHLADDCFKFAISGLAEMTARCLELSRKTAEVLCADDVKAKSMCLTRASLFRKNTEILRNELSSLASIFAHLLDEIATKSGSRRVSFLVTDVHLEGANCCTYMEDCHRLVLPILQLSAVR